MGCCKSRLGRSEYKDKKSQLIKLKEILNKVNDEIMQIKNVTILKLV